MLALRLAKAGQLLAQNVRLEEAQSELQAAIVTDPQNDGARTELAKLYLQRKEAGKQQQSCMIL
jgi:Tfp pilus assembly protein PilF